MASTNLADIARRICQKRHLNFVGPVGEGTFKQTFHVIDTAKCSLALKIYKAEDASPRSQREIGAMQKCNHKNIAKLLSVETFAIDKQRYLTLMEEYLPGGTLTSKGRLTVACSLEIGAQLIDALGHLAALKLVHRDIKPDNILFRADGTTPVLTDFGIVRDLNDSSITPTWVVRGPGTPLFSPAEQLNNQKHLIDWRTDQFALGVSLTISIFAQHPFREPGIYDPELVQRLASRQGAADWFVREATALGLKPLVRMVSAWPVDRFRKPAELAIAWGKQKG